MESALTVGCDAMCPCSERLEGLHVLQSGDYSLRSAELEVIWAGTTSDTPSHSMVHKQREEHSRDDQTPDVRIRLAAGFCQPYLVAREANAKVVEG
jgi:hypothetical protein